MLTLDHHLDPLQVRCEAFARPRLTFAIRMGCALVDLGSARSDAGLDFLEVKGLLLVVDGWGAKLLRSPAEAGPIEGFQDLGQSFDASISIGVSRLEICTSLSRASARAALSAMARTMAQGMRGGTIALRWSLSWQASFSSLLSRLVLKLCWLPDPATDPTTLMGGSTENEKSSCTSSG
nr:hypothetical protein RFYW14_04308 [Pseudorhizobium flavum]